MVGENKLNLVDIYNSSYDYMRTKVRDILYECTYNMIDISLFILLSNKCMFDNKDGMTVDSSMRGRFEEWFTDVLNTCYNMKRINNRHMSDFKYNLGTSKETNIVFNSLDRVHTNIINHIYTHNDDRRTIDKLLRDIATIVAPQESSSGLEMPREDRSVTSRAGEVASEKGIEKVGERSIVNNHGNSGILSVNIIEPSDDGDRSASRGKEVQETTTKNMMPHNRSISDNGRSATQNNTLYELSIQSDDNMHNNISSSNTSIKHKANRYTASHRKETSGREIRDRYSNTVHTHSYKVDEDKENIALHLLVETRENQLSNPNNGQSDTLTFNGNNYTSHEFDSQNNNNKILKNFNTFSNNDHNSNLNINNIYVSHTDQPQSNQFSNPAKSKTFDSNIFKHEYQSGKEGRDFFKERVERSFDPNLYLKNKKAEKLHVNISRSI